MTKSDLIEALKTEAGLTKNGEILRNHSDKIGLRIIGRNNKGGAT